MAARRAGRLRCAILAALLLPAPRAAAASPAAEACRRVADTGRGAGALEEVAAWLAGATDAEDRRACRDALGRVAIGETELRALLLDGREDLARAWAAHALGHHPGPTSSTLLLEALGDPAEAVRLEAIDALTRTGERGAVRELARMAVRDPSRAVRGRADEAARRLVADRRVPVDVSEALRTLEEGELQARIRVAGELGASGDWRAATPLLAAARAGPAPLRRAALAALGHLGDRRVVAPVAAMARSERGAVRYAAIGALAWLADESTVPTLAALLRDPDPTARQLAVRALGWVGGARAARALAGAVEDGKEAVRIELVLALERSRDAEALPLLAALGGDPSPFVRAEVARELAARGAPGAVATLLTLLDDRDALVRLAAADGLATLGAVEALPEIERAARRARSPEERATLLEAAGRLGGTGFSEGRSGVR